jgi:hypothetical protein
LIKSLPIENIIENTQTVTATRASATMEELTEFSRKSGMIRKVVAGGAEGPTFDNVDQWARPEARERGKIYYM